MFPGNRLINESAYLERNLSFSRSFRGNKKLKHIHEEAFVGIESLQSL